MEHLRCPVTAKSVTTFPLSALTPPQGGSSPRSRHNTKSEFECKMFIRTHTCGKKAGLGMKNSKCRRSEKALAVWEQGPQGSLVEEMLDSLH